MQAATKYRIQTGMHTSSKLLHTFVGIRTTLIKKKKKGAIIMRSRHETNGSRKQDVK